MCACLVVKKWVNVQKGLTVSFLVRWCSRFMMAQPDISWGVSTAQPDDESRPGLSLV